MLAEISYDETQQELIFFVGEADYQQELSQIVVLNCFARRKFWYLSDYDSRKSKQILEIYCSTLPTSVYKESVDYGEVPAMGGPLWPRIWQGITMHRQPGIRT